MRVERTWVLVTVGLITAAQPVRAQEPTAPRSAGASIGAGIGLGVVGFFAGGLVGSAVTSDCTSHDLCQLEGAFYGAAAGGTFGMSLGVHLGNRRQGNLALDFLVGAAVWAAGIGLVTATDWSGGVAWTMAVAIPVGQLAATIAVERATGRKRARARAATSPRSPAGR